MFGRRTPAMPDETTALKGRPEAIPTAETHYVTGRNLFAPVPEGFGEVVFGMGCFWGAERLFWDLDGVHLTQVGYAGGYTQNPTYEETCAGVTGHTEVVKVIYNPAKLSLEQLLKIFWEQHDPTQGMRQGNDIGTQYRSAIYIKDPDLLALARRSALDYGAVLQRSGLGDVTTEIRTVDHFYPAEDYHQQYLAKNPNGYCGIGGTGVSCPMPVRLTAAD
ncbi:MAG: peptide-methionine (S)-S-oxide reductase [Hyphomonadaceae bacterium]|nr:peptide-methionine (S)-S-oxide reductase [Hyphomonadaceae bacterium]